MMILLILVTLIYSSDNLNFWSVIHTSRYKPLIKPFTAVYGRYDQIFNVDRANREGYIMMSRMYI